MESTRPEAVTAWLEKALTGGAIIGTLLAVLFILGLHRDDDGRWMFRGMWGWGPTPVTVAFWQFAAIALLFVLVRVFGYFWWGR